MSPAEVFLSIVELVDRPSDFCVQGFLDPFLQPLIRVEGKVCDYDYDYDYDYHMHCQRDRHSMHFYSLQFHSKQLPPNAITLTLLLTQYIVTQCRTIHCSSMPCPCNYLPMHLPLGMQDVLAFPLSSSVAAEVVRQAERAGFGRGADRVLDTNVRDA
jgi:hypothetical protein